MILNMQGPIAAFQIPGGVQVLRRQQQNVINGYQAENPPQPLTIKANVQPLSPAQIMMLPEGERTREWISVFAIDAATQPLKTADVAAGTNADLVVWQGRSYEVMRLNNWKPTGGYWQADCAKVGQ